MYKLKDVARRGMTLAAAVALFGGIGVSALPATASADALNPLTARSLTLSSSSPGWANTDGSGNSTYAPPNSGANGQKTGNYFDFKVSTNSGTTGPGATSAPITAMSFQYCTTSAGECLAPGDDVTPGTDTSSTADLNVNYPSAAEVGSSDFSTVVDATTGKVKAVPGYTNENPKYQSTGGTGDPAEAAKAVAGNYIVMTNNAGTWVPNTGWTLTTSNQEEDTVHTHTGQNNTIILQNTTGMGLASGTEVKVLFFATATNYITNPGSGAFFVKINTFKNFDPLAGPTPGPENTLADNIAKIPSDVIDGGVTVANVMNQSIAIQTKVLETMQFSVGTVDPDTLSSAQLAASDYGSGTHTPCNTILTRMGTTGPENVLSLGNQSAESSLETTSAYATHSYWRLSSNSSAGATVYYSGHTLSNTSGDEIAPIGTTAKQSAPGSEQFGLALDTAAYTGGHTFDDATNGVDYTTAGANENGADSTAAGVIAANAANSGAGDPIQGVDVSVLTDLGAVNTPPWDYTALNKSFHMPRLAPLAASDGTGGTTNYGGGSGTITNAGTAEFAFDPLSDTIPAPIATESTQVVDCVTGKMRYIGNIAATTPAGIYTTKVNYIAAPQY